MHFKVTGDIYKGHNLSFKICSSAGCRGVGLLNCKENNCCINLGFMKVYVSMNLGFMKAYLLWEHISEMSPFSKSEKTGRYENASSVNNYKIELRHDKSNKMTCATSDDSGHLATVQSDQSLHYMLYW